MPLIDIACSQITRSNGIINIILYYVLEKEIDCSFTYDTGKNPKDRIRNLKFIVWPKQKIKMDFDFVQRTESLPHVPLPDLPLNIALSVKWGRAWRFVVVCVRVCVWVQVHVRASVSACEQLHVCLFFCCQSCCCCCWEVEQEEQKVQCGYCPFCT